MSLDILSVMTCRYVWLRKLGFRPLRWVSSAPGSSLARTLGIGVCLSVALSLSLSLSLQLVGPEASANKRNQLPDRDRARPIETLKSIHVNFPW